MNYFVEGLQGSGKSTLVRKIQELSSGYTIVREGDYSPVELAWCAYVDAPVYAQILEKYAEIRGQIEEKTVTEGEKKIICHTQILTDIPGFHKDLEQYEIYNGRIPYDKFRSILLRRYRTWHADHMIFECSLFQNTVEDMLLFRCASDAEVTDLYRQVAKVLADKEVHVLYLETEDIKGNLDVIRRERADEAGNELWYPLMCAFFDNSPYARANGLHGEEDLLRHFQHRQELELHILKALFSGKYTILQSKDYRQEDLALLLKNNES